MMTPEKLVKIKMIKGALATALASLEISIPRETDKALKRRMVAKVAQVDQTLAMLRDKIAQTA